MNEQVALASLIPPGRFRPNKIGGFGGVMQIHLNRKCDKACFGCTQGSQLAGATNDQDMTAEQFRQAVLSLNGYFGVVAAFGGNPALNKNFKEICGVLREHVPYARRGLWCNNPITLENAKVMRETFNPAVCNLNVHLDQKAFDLFKEGWPECQPFGLHDDSRHSPPYVAMKDVVADEAERWRLIASCDINRHWSAMIGVFRGQVRGWFCEIAGAQSILHQNEPDYPDTGMEVVPGWWQKPMTAFAEQVRKHCHDCGVPLRGHGALACGEGTEQVSQTHAAIFVPKRQGRAVELVQAREQLGKKVATVVDYIGNARR